MTRRWFFLFLLLTALSGAQEFRATNLEILKSAGFTVAPSLPPSSHRELRPQQEIENRLQALNTLVLWVAAPYGTDDTATLKKAATETYREYLTEQELAVFALSRAEAKAQYLDLIGWQMENMWSLAWVLGYNVPPALNGQLQGERARDLILKFVPTGQRQPRSLEEVRAMEDLFYCAHNAVRSAQQGGATVPKGYDPVAEGGGVQERRHALTWCLSPGVKWADTDLST